MNHETERQEHRREMEQLAVLGNADLKNIERQLAELTNFMQESLARQRMYDPFIARLIAEDHERNELAKSVKAKIIGTGVVAVMSAVCAIVWYGIKSWVEGRS